MDRRNVSIFSVSFFVLLIAYSAAASEKNDFPLTVTVIGADSQNISAALPQGNNTTIQAQACAGEYVNCTNGDSMAAGMQSLQNGVNALRSNRTQNMVVVEYGNSFLGLTCSLGGGGIARHAISNAVSHCQILLPGEYRARTDNKGHMDLLDSNGKVVRYQISAMQPKPTAVTPTSAPAGAVSSNPAQQQMEREQQIENCRKYVGQPEYAWPIQCNSVRDALRQQQTSDLARAQQVEAGRKQIQQLLIANKLPTDKEFSGFVENSMAAWINADQSRVARWNAGGDSATNVLNEAFVHVIKNLNAAHRTQ